MTSEAGSTPDSTLAMDEDLVASVWPDPEERHFSEVGHEIPDEMFDYSDLNVHGIGPRREGR